MCAAIGDAMQTPAPIFHTVAEAARSRETKRSEGETREVWRRRVERREEKNNAEETFAKWTARVRECDCACDCAVRLIDSRGSAPCVASHRTSSLEVRCCVVLCFLCGEVRCGALSLLIGAAVTRMHAGGQFEGADGEAAHWNFWGHRHQRGATRPVAGHSGMCECSRLDTGLEQ